MTESRQVILFFLTGIAALASFASLTITLQTRDLVARDNATIHTLRAQLDAAQQDVHAEDGALMELAAENNDLKDALDVALTELETRKGRRI